MKQSRLASLSVFMNVLLVCVFVMGLPFAWILRDGLGPDTQASTGLYAIVRTMGTFYIGPILLGLALLSLLLHLQQRKHNKGQ